MSTQPDQHKRQAEMFHKARMHAAARKRERQLQQQVNVMRRNHGWRSREAALAKARVKEFRRIRKITFGIGMTGAFNALGNSVSYRYKRRPYEWERWGVAFSQDWT